MLFKDQSERKKAGIILTGSVTFYESDVKLSNVIFKNNSSEDSLNIIDQILRLINLLFIILFLML